MKPLLKRFMQIGIIVRDLDEAVKNYEAIGIGPWDISALRNDVPPFEDLTVDGTELPEKGIFIKTAMMIAYGFEIELIEPVADSAFKKWLEEHGSGIHHVAFDLDDNYHDVLDKVKLDTGKDPWIRGQGVHGMMDFSYLDLREELGLIVECYQSLQPGKPALPYDMKGEITE